MANDYSTIDHQIDLNADAAQVLAKVREVYAQCLLVKAMIARFATDQTFSDTFDNLMFSGGFDGTAAISQMLYQINQLTTAWEGNAEWRAVLKLPPLP